MYQLFSGFFFLIFSINVNLGRWFPREIVSKENLFC